MKVEDIISDKLQDDRVTEVLVNSTTSMVIVMQHDRVVLDSPFDSREKMTETLQDFADSQGVRLDPVIPFCGGIYAESVRFHCMIPPVASDGPLLSLRHHRFDTFRLHQFGASKDLRRKLTIIMSQRAPLLLVGPTGSGKTTFLTALLRENCNHERVFLIEQIDEVPALAPTWVKLCAKPPNIQGHGAISLEEIIRQSMRLLPDRLVVGEIRGGEARAFLQASSTGHLASVTTIHGNSPLQGLAKLALYAEMSTENIFLNHAHDVFYLGVLSRGPVPKFCGLHKVSINPTLQCDPL